MSYATAALATYANMLGTLDHIVNKAEDHEKGEALLQARLAEDMFPLSICGRPRRCKSKNRVLAVVGCCHLSGLFARA